MEFKMIKELRVDTDTKQETLAQYLRACSLSRLWRIIEMIFRYARKCRRRIIEAFTLGGTDAVITENQPKIRHNGDREQALSIKQTTYSKYELGKINIPIEALIKLADFYETSIDYIVGRTDSKQAYPKKKNKL